MKKELGIYAINEKTGKYPFLSNWNWYMQTEINIISAYIEENEISHKYYQKNQSLSPQAQLEKGITNHNLDGYRSSFGDSVENLNQKHIYKKYFAQLMRNSVYVTTLSMFEYELEILCKKIYSEFLSSEKPGFTTLESYNDFCKRKKNKELSMLTIQLRQSYLNEVGQIQFKDILLNQWEILNSLYKIRNNIIHNFGRSKGRINDEKAIEKVNNYFRKNDSERLLYYSGSVIPSNPFLTMDKEKMIELNQTFIGDNLINFYKEFVTNLSLAINKRIK